MSLLLGIFAADILPVFIVAGVGFVLARRFHADVRTLSRVTFNALAPCLVFNLLVTSSLGAADLGRMVLFTTLLILALGVLARLVAIPLGLSGPPLAAFLLVAMFSNNGNYGLSAILFAFGREALTHASIFFVTNAVLMYTLGVFIASAGRRPVGAALAGVLSVPALYAVGLAGLVMATGVSLPAPVTRPVGLLADAAIPAMLLVLGMQLERGHRPGRVLTLAASSVIILVASPLLGALVAPLTGIAGVARQAAIAQSTMPAAVVNTIIALEYDVEPAFVTWVVLVTTLASPVTVTVVFALLGAR